MLGKYGEDFYAGMPALTVNDIGKGKAYYIAADVEESFLVDLYQALARDLPLRSATGGRLPEGVCARTRTDGETEYLFLLNFTGRKKKLTVAGGQWRDVVTGKPRLPRVTLEPYGFEIRAMRVRS